MSRAEQIRSRILQGMDHRMAIVLVFWRDGEARCEWEPELGRIRLVSGTTIHREATVGTSREALARAREFFDFVQLLDPAAREALRSSAVRS
jgi:hypothetical protein